MKKIIALLLILATAFALAACRGKDPDPVGTSDGSATVADYNEAISKTNPSVVTIRTTFENTAPAATLEGEYVVTYNVDGTATIVYEYDVLNSIGADEMVSKKQGTAQLLADGKISGSIDKTVAAAAVGKIALDEKKMDYDISMGTLNAVIKAANTKAVLGIELGSDATLLMRITNDGYIGSYSISYSTSAGNADIVCIFS